MIRITSGVSGAEVYNLNLLSGLRKYKDLDISFITNSREFSDRVRNLGVKSVCLPIPVKEIGTKKDFLKAVSLFPVYLRTYLKGIGNLEKGEKFDLIVLQSMTEKIFLTPILKLKGYNVIWIEHGPLFITNRTSVIKKSYRIASKFTNKIIAVSKDTKKDLIRGGINKNKIETVYIGIDVKHFSPLASMEKNNFRAKLKIPEKNLIIGSLGTITEEKGIKEFIEVANNIYKKTREVFFLLVGNGPLFSWAKNEVKKLKIDNAFYFSEKVVDVRSYLGIMDIFFFPTKHNEGISMSILEAMSMGVLVMAYDIGGNKELIEDDKTGIMINDLNKNLVNEILKYKGNNILRRNARDFVQKHFNINIQAERFYEFFNTI